MLLNARVCFILLSAELLTLHSRVIIGAERYQWLQPKLKPSKTLIMMRDLILFISSPQCSLRIRLGASTSIRSLCPAGWGPPCARDRLDI